MNVYLIKIKSIFSFCRLNTKLIFRPLDINLLEHKIMKNGSCALFYKTCFYSIAILKKTKFAMWMLIALVLSFSDSFISIPPSAVARENELNSISVERNIIYVNPKSGNDSQSGEQAHPLKTITQALENAESGAKIQLAIGTYSEETGEIFPLIIDRQITLQGNIKNQGHNIVIKGSGDFVSPTGAGQNVAIAVLKDVEKVAGITITNNHSRGHGLWVESSNPEIIANTFTRNGNTGMSVNGKSSPLIENNYFYNNSGNGLSIYGTSQPKVIENTFEQTGFGVSLIQNAIATLKDNYFDGNRIGIILEGSSQATLRDNEIVNSLESGLTAIALSRVDLGTTKESGNNVFRSNKKLDIQNATTNEIAAVGTETSGNVRGKINFDRAEYIASANTEQKLRPLLTPLDSNKDSVEQPKAPSATPTSSLPSPPPVGEQNSVKELVFTASSSAASESADPEPVPFLPQSDNSALDSNSSEVSSLSDVLGSGSRASVKYKVLVEAVDPYASQKVRSLYPEAFATIYQGKSVLQIGAFNNWDKAKEAEKSLGNLGLETYILE